MTSYKILTVDDSVVIRKIVTKAFQSYNCVINEAENGAEGLVEIYRDKPDLIILDLTMPVMNGIEMLEKLKQDAAMKTVPVIMLTAESSKDTVMQILKLGVKDYIAKPFQADQLIERAKKYLTLEEKVVSKYFSTENDIHVIQFPSQPSSEIASEIKNQLVDFIGKGANKFILDLTQGDCSGMSSIKLLGVIFSNCEKSNVKILVLADPSVANSLKDYQETAKAKVSSSMDGAKQQLNA